MAAPDPDLITITWSIAYQLIGALVTAIVAIAGGMMRWHWHRTKELREEVADYRRRLERERQDREQELARKRLGIHSEQNGDEKGLKMECVRLQAKCEALEEALEERTRELADALKSEADTSEDDGLDDLAILALTAIANSDLKELARNNDDAIAVRYRLDVMEKKGLIAGGIDGWYLTPKARKWMFDHGMIK